MAGVVLATGILELIPSMRGSQSRITSELSKVNTAPVGAAIGKKMGGGIAGSLTKVVGGALAGIGAMKVKGLTTDAVASFSELEDSTAAAGVVFGKNIAQIVKQSQGASKTLGLSSQQVISAANTYGTYGKAAGLAGADLATFATDFTGLAADMASFKGTSPEQAIEAIGAALRGETEPIRAYGVMLDDASLRQKALELGITDTVKNALTPQQKILAAQSLIFEQTADAQGDYARTSESTANVAKTLAAETENVSAKFGQVLAPAFTAARVRAIGAVGGVSLLLDKVLAFQDVLAGGGTTVSAVKALGLDPSEGFGLVVNEAIGGMYAWTAAWKANDGEITSSGFPGWMEKTAFTVRTAVDGMRGAASDLFQGDFSSIGPFLEAAGAVARPAAPIFVELAKGMGAIATEVGGLLASGLPLLVPILEGATGVMNYLAENTGVLAVVLGGLAAGYVTYKAAQAAANVATLLHIPVTLANAAANRSLAGAIRAANTSSGLQATANKKTGATMFTAAAATTGATVATGAYAGAATGASVASRVLGAAVRALPFVGLAAIVATAIAGLVWFFTETETGKDIVAGAWSVIQGAIGGVVDWFTGTAVPAAQTALGAVGTAMDWLNTNVVQPVFRGVQTAVGWGVTAFNWLRDTTAPVFESIGVILGGFGLFFRGVFQVVVSIFKNIVGPAFVNFWNGVVVPVFAGIGATISGWWATASAVFGVVVGFIRTTLAAGFTWFRDTIITPVFDFVGGVISRAWTGWERIFGAVVGFLHDTFGPAFTWFRDTIITPVWDFISDKIEGVWRDHIEPVFGFFGDAIEVGLPAAFEVGKKAIDDIWTTIQDIVKAPVEFVIVTVLNNGLIAGFNKIADILPDVDRLPDIALPAGWYEGGRTGGNDPRQVRGVVHGQEVVVPHRATAKIDRTHPGLLDALVEGDTAALGAPMPGSLPFIWGSVQQAIARTGIARIAAIGGYPSSDLGQAAAAWNGRAGVRVVPVSIGSILENYQRGTNWAAVRYGGMQQYPGAIGLYSGNGIDISPSGPNRLATLIHEVGHFLGIHHNTGNMSVMHPMLGGGGAYWPTAYDTANLQRIYGPPGAGAKATTAPDGEDGGWWNPIDAIISGLQDALNGLVQSVLDKFAGAGIMTDIAVSVGKKIWNTAVDWFKGLIGLGQKAQGVGQNVNPMVFDGGGWLENTGGRSLLVQHNERRPDAVLPDQEFRDMHRLARDAMDDVEERDGFTAIFNGTDFDQAQKLTDTLYFEKERRRVSGPVSGRI